MSNELNNIVCLNANGVYEGVAIGGDRSVQNDVLFLFFEWLIVQYTVSAWRLSFKFPPLEKCVDFPFSTAS